MGARWSRGRASVASQLALCHTTRRRRRTTLSAGPRPAKTFPTSNRARRSKRCPTRRTRIGMLLTAPMAPHTASIVTRTPSSVSGPPLPWRRTARAGEHGANGRQTFPARPRASPAGGAPGGFERDLGRRPEGAGPRLRPHEPARKPAGADPAEAGDAQLDALEVHPSGLVRN